MAFNIDNKFIRKIRVNDASANIENRNITKLYISGNPEGEYSWAESYNITPLPDTVTGIDLSTVEVSGFYINKSDAKMVNINLYKALDKDGAPKMYIRDIIASNSLLYTNSDDMNSYVYNSEKLYIEAKPVKGYTSVNYLSQSKIIDGVTSDINLSDYILEPDGLITLEKPRVLTADTMISGIGTQYDTDLSGEIGDEELTATIINDNNMDVVLYYELYTVVNHSINLNNMQSVEMAAHATKLITFDPLDSDFKYLYLIFKYGAAQSETYIYKLSTHDIDVESSDDEVVFVTEGKSGTYTHKIVCNSSYYKPLSKNDPLWANSGIFITFVPSTDDSGYVTFSPNNLSSQWEGTIKVDNSIITAVNQDSSKVYNCKVYVQLKWFKSHYTSSGVMVYDEERYLTEKYPIAVQIRYSIPIDYGTWGDEWKPGDHGPGVGIPGGPERPGTGGGKYYTTVVGFNGNIISQLQNLSQTYTNIGKIGGASSITNINTNTGGINLG